MGTSEQGKSSKSEKPAATAPLGQPNNVHVYPDWAAMQAYYGPRVAVPPYYNPAVAPGHTPHPFMWAPPQAMMPPYGAPYAAVYSHGGVYAHHAVPMGTTPPSGDSPTKSSGNKDKSLMKKLKGFDGLAMSIGNGETVDGEENRHSRSVETEGSSDGSNVNSVGGKKRSLEGTPTIGGDGVPAREAKGSSNKLSESGAAPASVPGKTIGPVILPSMTSSLELKTPLSANDAKSSPTNLQQTCAVVSSEVWAQNERELKRERRKQSNRESARRSRLRKQAEIEELARKVETLTAENATLKSEINQMTGKSQNLKLENAALMEKLNGVQLGHIQEGAMNDVDYQRGATVNTENLISQVENSGNTDKNGEASDAYERSSNSGAKLHQLLNASPRADAVAAG